VPSLLTLSKKAGKDSSVRVTIISGEGKAFCSGQDLKDIKGELGKRSLGDSVLRRYNPMIMAIRDMPKPVICRLNGVAAGAGASLSFGLRYDYCCRKRFAHRSVCQRWPCARLWLFFLSCLIWWATTKRSNSSALPSKISAQEAQQLGFIYKVVACRGTRRSRERFSGSLCRRTYQVVRHHEENAEQSLHDQSLQHAPGRVLRARDSGPQRRLQRGRNGLYRKAQARV
jgi:enoyl-CoA hydratase/carnithine racemase